MTAATYLIVLCGGIAHRYIIAIEHILIKERNSTLKIFTLFFTLVLALSSGVAAMADSYMNAVRASHGCAPYSPEFVYSVAIQDAKLMFVPTMIIILLTIISYWRTSTLVASFLTTLIYSVFIYYSLIHDVVSNYAPCDQKGDESSLGLLIMGIFILPMAWVVQVFCFEIANCFYLYAKNRSNKINR